MKLSDLTLSDLKRIRNLLAAKEKLNRQITAVNRQLERFEAPAPAKPSPRPPRKPARFVPHGQVKTKIINALKAAGKAGLHINEVAAKVKNKPGNVRTWFLTTGKNVKNIRKVGPAKYRWQD